MWRLCSGTILSAGLGSLAEGAKFQSGGFIMRTLPSTLGAAAISALSLALATASARADTVVYNGGAPNQGGTTYAESTLSFVAAMNFTLPSGVSSVSDANWWGGCYPSTTCGSSPDFVLSFYQDSGTNSGPGTLITSFDVGGANQTATGNLIGGSFDEYAYSATFAPVLLTPGTEYWFGITGTTGAGQFGVEQTSSAPAGSQLYTLGIYSSTVWHLEVEQGAFELTAVPEPSTWAMMLLGFAGIGYAGYRKRLALASA